jgi:ABC-2 type transport system ATP-binding protein
MNTRTILSVENLTYQYPNAIEKQLNEVSFKIHAGDRFGIFGPNGAGKTTLMHVMLGVLSDHNGEVKWFDDRLCKHDSLYQYVGIVPQDFSFYEELTFQENLNFFGAWYGLSKPEIQQRSLLLAQTFGLTDYLNIQVKKFSGGMKRRVNLAIGVLHQPKILFLDEPTVGVDIQSRHAIMDYLMHINKVDKVTLVYTSHHLREAQMLCTDFLFLDNGKKIATYHHDELTANGVRDLESIFIELTGKQYRDE